MATMPESLTSISMRREELQSFLDACDWRKIFRVISPVWRACLLEPPVFSSPPSRWDASEQMLDDTLLPLEEWLVKVDAVLEEVTTFLENSDDDAGCGG